MTEEAKPTCPTCHGEGWVCENHQDKPWNADGCECGAGAPCPTCNPCDADHPPEMPAGTTIIADRGRGYLQ